MSIRLITTGAGGIVAVGATGDTRLWDTVTGAVAIDAAIVNGSAASLKFVANATTPWLAKNNPSGARTVVYFRGDFYVTDATPASDMRIFAGNVGLGSDARLTILTTGVLRMSMGASTQDGPTITDAGWFSVELEIDTRANPNIIKWRTRNVTAGGAWIDRTNVSVAQAIDTVDSFQIGIMAGPTSAETLYWANVSEGSASSSTDYPATGRDRFVARLLPASDGTHSFTSGDMKDTGGSNIAVGSTTVYQLLDDADQSSLADYVQQAVIRSTGYVEVAFADPPANHVPVAVGILATLHSSGVNANTASIRVSDDAFAHEAVVVPLDDVSDTTAHYEHVVMATKPSDSGAWTYAALCATKARLGYSTDVTDIPYFDSISLAYLYEVTAALATRAPYAGGGFYP